MRRIPGAHAHTTFKKTPGRTAVRAPALRYALGVAFVLAASTVQMMSTVTPAHALKPGCWPGYHWNSYTQTCEADLCLPPKKMINGKCVTPSYHPSTGGNVALAKCNINPSLPECKPCPPGYKKINGKCVDWRVK